MLEELTHGQWRQIVVDGEAIMADIEAMGMTFDGAVGGDLRAAVRE